MIGFDDRNINDGVVDGMIDDSNDRNVDGNDEGFVEEETIDYLLVCSIVSMIII